MFTPTSASRADSSSEGVPGPGAVDGVEEACPCSVQGDKGWLRRYGGPAEKVPSLAAPTLMLVHLTIDPEVQTGPWQRVLENGRGGAGQSITQLTSLGLSFATSQDQQGCRPQTLLKEFRGMGHWLPLAAARASDLHPGMSPYKLEKQNAPGSQVREYSCSDGSAPLFLPLSNLPQVTTDGQGVQQPPS